jgi:ribonucleoside-triphosphate reductase
MVQKIIKRDHREVDFDELRITNAITNAMKCTKMGVDIELAESISNSIGKTDKKIMSIEEVQNLVVYKLMSSKRKDVAIEYIIYREDRNKQRELSEHLDKKIEEILDCSNITNDNANIDQYSFSGKEQRIVEDVNKEYSKNNLLRNNVKEYYEKGYTYIHDFGKYNIGYHNCLFVDFKNLFENGFETRNGDVRKPNSVDSAFQLVAVIFQCQSQVQFGGVGNVHLDTDLAPFVAISFKKYFEEGLKWLMKIDNPKEYIELNNLNVKLNNEELKNNYKDVYEYAYEHLEKEGLQAAESLYHNLNTLESRAGAQVPFTSINLGRDTSIEGQMVTEWIFKASLDGIGKYHKTSIFPISIFQYKKGINDKPGTKNYNLKKLAIKSMCKRIYPNWVNGDFSGNIEDENNPDTFMATMGCRTAMSYDRFTDSYIKVGRGNVTPCTMILPKLGIEYGICLGKREQPDLEGFWKKFEEVLDITKQTLLDRFYLIAEQSPKAAPFMYKNKTIMNAGKCKDNVYEAMKHGSQAIGYIGLAEMCKALFGKTHDEDPKVQEFAISVIKHISDYAKKASDEHNLNFGCYATPAESLCYSAMGKLQKEYGKIQGITDKEYLTNSHHVPVWHEISIYDKLKIEAPYCKYATSGCITYVELDSKIIKNQKAIEKIIDFAMDLDIPYLAFNFPINTCNNCGYSENDVDDTCPKCNSENIEHLARVTGYLTTDTSNFNKGKKAEVKDRIKHSQFTDLE